MSKLTYKILIDPITFDTFVRELTVPTEEGDGPLLKRDMTNEEVEAKWNEEEFIEVMSEHGYGPAASIHINNYGMFQS